MEEEETNKRDPWPTGFFDCCSGGISLCLWGFLCPTCLDQQGWTYANDLQNSPKNVAIESQFERYPPWSCRALLKFQAICMFFTSCCCCCYGFFVGSGRHQKYFRRNNFEYYCSSQPCCCCTCCHDDRCCDDIPIEDCLIGYFCCCCSIIQVTMVNDEQFRMRSKVEGDVNIKRAL